MREANFVEEKAIEVLFPYFTSRTGETAAGSRNDFFPFSLFRKKGLSFLVVHSPFPVEQRLGPSVCLSVYFFVSLFLSVLPRVCLSGAPSVSHHTSVCENLFVSVCSLSVCMSVFPPVCLSVFLSCLSVCLSVCRSTSLFNSCICLTDGLYLYLFIC